MEGTPGKYNQTIYHGQEWESAPFSLVMGGNAINLAGGTIAAALRSARGRHPFTVAVSPGGNAFKLALSYEEILALPPGKYLFDLVIKDLLPLDLVWLRGDWAVSKGASYGN
jgi:hypothetical protein